MSVIYYIVGMVSDNSEIVIYQTQDGLAKMSVRIKDGTVWLSQAQMADLFQTTPQNITLHIKNIYQDGELHQGATCKEYLQVQSEGVRSVSHPKETRNYLVQTKR